ncbi:hypothetical protein [Hydrogenimonas sp. SS33]|uniref:hypothetical protein n=1 Tax=Hydrogenimonas leucolamina TaxID=2954236 RepID=UPI00336BE0C2
MLEEVLEKYTVEVVINRTKISRKNLEKLKNGNFEGFTKPQAYGFLRILQREFDEDFSDLEARLDDWFANAPESLGEPIFKRDDGEVKGGSKGWILLLVLLVLAGAGYYLYQKEAGEPARTQGPVTPAATVPTRSAPAAVKETEKVPQAGQEKATPSAVPSAEENASETAAEVNATAEETVSGAKKKEAEPEPYVPLEPVALTPKVKLWFGIIDLKTKKRTAKVISNPYEIDSHGRKLVITGHGRFEISDAFGNLFKYNDAKKHYFLIDDGLVKEIDAAEFRRLNGGKGW